MKLHNIHHQLMNNAIFILFDFLAIAINTSHICNKNRPECQSNLLKTKPISESRLISMNFWYQYRSLFFPSVHVIEHTLMHIENINVT